MAADAETLAVFGFLGKPPMEIVNGPISIVRRYRELADRAGKVARLSRIPHRRDEWEREAKRIEHEYQELVQEARRR